MNTDKVNDWIKVPGVQLVAGIIAVIFDYIYWMVQESAMLYVLIGFNVVALAYYILAGIFLKNVKTYKVLLVFIAMFAIIFCCALINFDPGIVGVFLSGGTHIMLKLVLYFIPDILNDIRSVIFYGGVSYLAPIVITYISMKICQYREERLWPYLEEVMNKNDEKQNSEQ